MISYIITTIRQPELANKTIESIKRLGIHNHEVIVSSPNDIWGRLQGCNQFIKEINLEGSVAANNAAIKIAKGNWLAFLPDDFHLINLDINEFQAFLDGPEMTKKVFKMFSFHPRSCHLVDNIVYKTPINEPYQIMHFPIVARETIDNQLNGVVFNHRFKHSYCDHFLGYYASLHEQYEPLNYSLYQKPGPFITLNTDTQYRNYSFDNSDYYTLATLYNLSQNQVISYNI